MKRRPSASLTTSPWQWGAAAATVAFAILTLADSLAPVDAWNRALSLWLQGPDVYPLTVIGSAVAWLFSGQVTIGVSVIGAMLLWLAGRRKAAVSLCAVLPLVAAEVALKYAIRHPSPDGVLAVRTLVHIDVGPRFLQFSFPSGHAARAAFLLLWTPLWLFGERYRAAAAGAAALLLGFIGWGRIYAGDHWLLDVVAGFLLAGFFLAGTGLL
ncbi:MAG: phosphatase PAP2 family protein, partial [Chloroflexota bacterium]|nr:phosphatase PAP2 family protein [Chloroflexota bacterium]